MPDRASSRLPLALVSEIRKSGQFICYDWRSYHLLSTYILNLVLLKRKNKKRLIIDLDSTEDPAHGKQEGVAYHGHFAKNCFHPLFAFTSDGDCLGAKLRPGNVHSADGALKFIKPIVKRYRGWFKLFWFRGDAAFANPETYEYCEEHRASCKMPKKWLSG
ncbi:MAG: transposase [Deltaproteobacteria bacterium]|nr:transposase [Deltaproteobacteria bacterium]